MYNSENLPLSWRKVPAKSSGPVFLILIYYLATFQFFPKIIMPVINTAENSSNIKYIFGWPLLILIAIAIFTVVYEYFYYKLYRYDFGAEQIMVRKGVIARETGYAKYNRLQNIYVTQGIMDRIFGIYDVHFETAGETSNTYSHVHGLMKNEADKLLEFLNSRTKTGSGSATLNV